MPAIEPSPASDVSPQTLQYSTPLSEGPRTRFRWVILLLVFFAVTINYLDRLIMAVLSPDLMRIFQMTKVEYGWTASAFALSYAFGQVVSGGILDKIGVRVGYALSIAAWSFSAILHAFARGPIGFSVARGLLGASESPAYPAATKTLAEWFPKRERAFAFGFVNAGSNMGAILAPMVIPLLAGPQAVHWQWAFIFSGVVGLLWLLFWLPLYRSPEKHPHVNQAELMHIQSDPPESAAPIRWQLTTNLFSHKGRIPRGVFWEIILGLGLLTIPVWTVASLARNTRAEHTTFTLLILWSLFSFTIALLTQIKRLHDLGKSGWISAVNFIPGGSIFTLAWLGSKQGEPIANQFGPAPTYTSLLAYPQAWAFAIGKFLTDSMWWFYMSWFPTFLASHHNLDLQHIGLPLIVVYVLADIGSIAGGWLSSIMIKAGFSINVSRKIAMLIPALGVVPVIFAQNVSGMWSAVLLMGLATASHQAFSSNLYTLVSDTFPKRAVASIAGFGGMFGYFGAAIFQPIVGHLVEEKNNYIIPFVCAGSAYLLALGVIHLLAPRLRPADIDEENIPNAIPATN